jgi:hypothetical protein
MRAVLATFAALVMVVGAGCQPNRKSVEVVNACDQELRVRIWDRPAPGNLKQNFFKEATVSPVSRVTVKVVTDNGERDWSAEILAGPGTGEVLPIKHTTDRLVIIPARLCSS